VALCKDPIYTWGGVSENFKVSRCYIAQIRNLGLKHVYNFQNYHICKFDTNRTKTHKVNKNGSKSTHKPIILTEAT